MKYHHLIPAPGFTVIPRSRDYELRRCVDSGDVPGISIPDYDFKRKHSPHPAYPFSFGAGLMSLELQEILNDGIGPKDHLQWVSCTVYDEELPVRYVIPILKASVELDPTQSTFGPGGPIRWVLKAASLTGRHVIKVPGVPIGLVVSDQIRQEIDQRRLTGLEWLPARLA